MKPSQFHTIDRGHGNFPRAWKSARHLFASSAPGATAGLSSSAPFRVLLTVQPDHSETSKTLAETNRPTPVGSATPQDTSVSRSSVAGMIGRKRKSQAKALTYKKRSAKKRST